MEENGVAMRRMQTNLSERYQSSRSLASPSDGKQKGGTSRVLSLRRALHLKTKNDDS